MLEAVLRFIPLAALLAGLVLVVPSAAQIGSGRIAYATDGNGIYTVAADGSPPVILKSGNARLPRWSPDGSKIAFIEYTGNPQTGVLVQLKVMNADGTGEHVVATGDWWQDIWLSNQPWSADGSRIAWGPSLGDPGGDIYTASAAGGDVRRITTDGRQKEAPVWSPAGPQLVYASSVPGSSPYWQLFLARDDGSAPVQITLGVQPSWSPSGASIAFLRLASPDFGIYVVRPDGTELHRVVAFTWSSVESFEIGRPAWSPDGYKIAYTRETTSIGRYVPPGQAIFVVNADGSHERRLTKLALQGVFDVAPTWSPDGDQILFRRGANSGSLMTMNPDGTCQGSLAAVGAWESPSWQAVPGGPTVGRKTCPYAMTVEGTTTLSRDGSAITILGTISNKGTEPLTNVQLTISAPGHDLGLQPLRGYGCTRSHVGLFCHIDRIGGGESRDVAVLGTARRVGRDRDSRTLPLRARLDVTADGSFTAQEHEADEVSFTPSGCMTLDPGRGRIDGTRFRDRICGRLGRDLIHPGLESDVVEAGNGNDAIFARDRYADRISCGRGRDTVRADRIDRVARDCERVIRR